jgi:hypothetical protein
MMYADNECSYTQDYEKNTYTFKGTCINTQKEHSVTVPSKGLWEYRQGALIQNAFPNVSSKDREFLISGTMWEQEKGEIK